VSDAHGNLNGLLSSFWTLIFSAGNALEDLGVALVSKVDVETISNSKKH
jgi:hypothetical protein